MATKQITIERFSLTSTKPFAEVLKGIAKGRKVFRQFRNDCIALDLVYETAQRGVRNGKKILVAGFILGREWGDGIERF